MGKVLGQAESQMEEEHCFPGAVWCRRKGAGGTCEWWGPHPWPRAAGKK